LVPENAIINESPERTFADMKQALVLNHHKPARVFGDDGSSNNDVPAIGCGNVPGVESSGQTAATTASVDRRRLQVMVEDASVCNNSTNFVSFTKNTGERAHSHVFLASLTLFSFILTRSTAG